MTLRRSLQRESNKNYKKFQKAYNPFKGYKPFEHITNNNYLLFLKPDHHNGVIITSLPPNNSTAFR